MSKIVDFRRSSFQSLLNELENYQGGFPVTLLVPSHPNGEDEVAIPDARTMSYFRQGLQSGRAYSGALKKS